jgi:hypothetical protein
VKNRLHLDVYTDDHRRLTALGARVLTVRPEWVVLADVEGNEFCAFPDPAPVDGAPGRAFAVCTDSDRPEELAAWWAPLVGAWVGDGPDGTPRWLHGCAGWDGLIWKFVRVADERVAPDRWLPSVTAGPGFLVAAGAVRVAADRWADPQGNAFRVADPASGGAHMLRRPDS